MEKSADSQTCEWRFPLLDCGLIETILASIETKKGLEPGKPSNSRSSFVDARGRA